MPVDEATAGAEEAASDGELKGRALSATLVTIVGHFGGNGVRLASNLILTRLLLPEHFGIMALVNVALIGLHMFSDVGIGPNVIQHEHGEDRAFLHTAFTVQTARGVWLLIAGCLLAWPIAHFYEIPDLVWMIPIAATTALTDGFTSTKVFRENRRLRLGRVTAIEVAAQVSTAVTMIVIALITRSIIALLVGSIAGSLVRVVLSHTMLPGFRDGFAWDPEARKALLTFGRWIFVSTAITFISMQVDRLVLGKLVDIELLGVYSIAVTLAAVPREVLGQLAQRVLYPVVAQVVRGKGAREKLRAIRRTTLAILIVPSGFLAGEGVAVFNVLYDDRYAAGGPMMMILCIGTWLTLVQMTYGVVVLAMARPKWISFGTALKSVVFLVAGLPQLRGPRRDGADRGVRDRRLPHGRARGPQGEGHLLALRRGRHRRGPGRGRGHVLGADLHHAPDGDRLGRLDRPRAPGARRHGLRGAPSGLPATGAA